jgi:hypothetical protein
MIGVLLVSVETLVLVALIAYMIHHDRTSVAHLRSFTPVCPNCGLDVRATEGSAAHPKVRLRDHFKECVS